MSFYVPLRRVAWCNKHDIPWASHTDVGISTDGCERGTRLMEDTEKVKKYGALYSGLEGELIGEMPGSRP